MDYNELAVKADEARKNAYCIYSKFSVGTALLAKSGKVYTGCNMENASFPAGSCAENTAFSKAISEGERGFTAIAIAGGPKGAPSDNTFPCGVCRQLMNEFTDRNSFDVLIVQKDLSYKAYKLKDLLPYSFGPEDMEDLI
ncbi:MAG: cytidine deaminase [Lachnospiraceae bacterium]|nr:cytidine deaminase [Lachnospiraceae bacterium]